MPTLSETRSRGLGASRPDVMDADASEVEAIDVCPPRRLRKPSAKAQQSEENRGSLDAALLSSGDQNGGTEQRTVVYNADTRKKGRRGGVEQTSVRTMQDQMEEQTIILKTLLEAWTKQEAYHKKVEAEVGLIKQELQAVKEECQAVKDELRRTKQEMADGIATLASAQSSPRLSYADVARIPPTSHPSNITSLSSNYTTRTTFTNTLYCTIDTSRVEKDASDQVSAGAIRAMVENGMRNEQDNATWRCRAVTMDPKNPHRVRIACRDEAEHKTVKQAVEANLVQGARILRDDLYPIRVDSVNRTAVLDETGNIRTGATEALSKENDTQVAKIAWLSNRAVPKAYGSMVVYLTKVSDARRFLQEGFFYAGGESGYTKAFERRDRPNRCYNCQEITSHKAYQCTKPQVCGRCAKEGHHQTECTEAILKCVPCGGPHESFSRNCRKFYPSQHE